MRLDLIFTIVSGIYINSNLKSLTKYTSCSRSTELREAHEYPAMEHVSNNYEDHPNQHENSHKLCDETGHPILSLTESQKKLIQLHAHGFPNGGKALFYNRTNTSVKRKK